ncbi:hypothetical protein [Halalkalibacter akibai]|uniref:Uncharacterized protein n=1 Tax=Halalkalibacter akibai (strain ATCC 43226 / DSM 21942 / CIP 109018 / JCM 9157 / 1139) TaxID=1236973 RepID=W4QQP4_HALA3|nr:hypothetical protein [Halalkalibacter akibai]GAE33674.1 hypothetical protein JCM9157_695 [Halalkalibacter akibai JCM 9157]
MKNKPHPFDDVPSGEKISYAHFLYYLKQGREIEFMYQHKEYFISHTSEGRALWAGQIRLSKYFGESNEDLANFAKIGGVPLGDLFKQNKIQINAVF